MRKLRHSSDSQIKRSRERWDQHTAYQSLTTPDVDQIKQTMMAAVSSAGVHPRDIDYINAHGTATKMNDKIEAEAISCALGSAADDVVVSSTKGMHGHLLGAAGAIEFAASLAAIEKHTAPPNANYVEPDPEISINLAGVAPTSRPVKTVMTVVFCVWGGTTQFLYSVRQKTKLTTGIISKRAGRSHTDSFCSLPDRP